MPFGDMVQEKQASTQIGKVGGGRRVLHGTTNEVMEDREGGSTDFSVFMPMLCALFDCPGNAQRLVFCRSEDHTSELQSLMRISYAVFCLKKKQHIKITIIS